MNWIITMGWLVTQSQTFWSAKSNGPLRSTAACKASGCNEIPAELYKSLKKDAIKVLHSLWQQIWKTQQWPQYWKSSILIPISKKGSTNHQTITLISHASKHACQASAVYEPRTSRCPSLEKGLEKEEELNCKHSPDYRKSKGIS